MNRSMGIVRAGLCVAALAAVTGLMVEPATAETWYAQRVTQSGGGVGVEHLWSSGASLRSEVVVGAHPVVTVVHGDRYWIIDRLTGAGISVVRHRNAVAADDPAGRPFADEAERLKQAGGEFIRDESLGGDMKCQLYKLTDDRGRQEVCVRKDDTELPVFIKSWDRGSKREAMTQYVNWIKDLPIGPEFFAPTPGANVTPYTYEAYVKAAREGSVGPAPVLYPHLLHGYKAE